MLISDIPHQLNACQQFANVNGHTLTKLFQKKNGWTLRAYVVRLINWIFCFQALVKTSRLETGAIRLEKKDSSLFHTLAQAMSSIVYAAEKKEIAVSVDCPENLIISHDSKWTSEALFNLLDNAVKYTPSGGKISVSVVQWEMYVGQSDRHRCKAFQKAISRSHLPGASIVRKKYTINRVWE